MRYHNLEHLKFDRRNIVRSSTFVLRGKNQGEAELEEVVGNLLKVIIALQSILTRCLRECRGMSELRCSCNLTTVVGYCIKYDNSLMHRSSKYGSWAEFALALIRPKTLHYARSGTQRRREQLGDLTVPI